MILLFVNQQGATGGAPVAFTDLTTALATYIRKDLTGDRTTALAGALKTMRAASANNKAETNTAVAEYLTINVP